MLAWLRAQSAVYVIDSLHPHYGICRWLTCRKYPERHEQAGSILEPLASSILTLGMSPDAFMI